MMLMLTRQQINGIAKPIVHLDEWFWSYFDFFKRILFLVFPYEHKWRPCQFSQAISILDALPKKKNSPFPLLILFGISKS